MKTNFNINAFKKLLNRSADVWFTFAKKNGEIRMAHGSTNRELLEAMDALPKGADYELSEEIIRYYDIDKGGWRSFHIDSLMSVDDAILC